jgi:hypothetical protein
MGKYYLHDSDGAHTNLQLYSLKKALECWEEIQDLVQDGKPDGSPQLRERCAFALAAMGLSVSQLLGQNVRDLKEDWVDSPEKVFEALAGHHEFHSGLVEDCKRFFTAYKDVRHFGRTVSGNRHRAIDDLSLEETRQHMETGRAVWMAVIAAHGKEPKSDLVAFSFDSVTDDEIVYEDRESPWEDGEEGDAPSHTV